MYMYHIFIHSSVDGHLGCFHVLALINSVAVNIGIHVSFWVMVFSGYMPSSRIAGSYGLPWWVSGKKKKIQLSSRRHGFDPWVKKIPWRRKWKPTPVFLPGKSHGQRSLGGYSSWGHKRVGHVVWQPNNNNMIVLHLFFKDNSILFSTVTVPSYIPINSVRGFLIPHPLWHLLFVDFFDDVHSDCCEVLWGVPHCSFDLHFSNN